MHRLNLVRGWGGCLAWGVGLSLMIVAASAGAQSPDSGTAAPVDAALAQASVLDQSFAFDIPAQKASTALLELSRQARVQVLMSGNVLDTFQTAGLKATLTLGSAFEALLSGTPYTYRQTGSNAITVDLPEALEKLAGYTAGTGVAVESDSALAEAAAIPVASIADESVEQAPSSTAEEQPGTQRLDDIVVTATKRKERLRDIPQSITAYSGEALEKQGKLNLFDYIQETPGVTASQGANGQMRITMRGINTDASPYSGLVSPVGVFIGDVPFTDSYIVSITPDLSAFDLADVEILKGPQGTLFGGAALSGAVRYQLQEPVLGEWQARGFSQYIKPDGGSTAITSGVAGNLPLFEDKLALRLVYVDRELPGLIDDLRSGEKNVDEGSGDQIRAILLWKPDDEWTLKLTHLKQDFYAPSLQVSNSQTERTDNLTLFKKPVRNGFSMDAAEIGYDFSDMRLTSVSSRVIKHSYSYSDNTYIITGPLPPAFPADLGIYGEGFSNAESFNQELRLQSTGDGPFKWLVGAYYNRYDMNYSSVTATLLTDRLAGPGSIAATLAAVLGIPASALDNLTLLKGLADAVTQERALFADAKYTLWGRLDLGAGIRFYQTQLDGGFRGSGILVLVENNGQNTDTTGILKEKGVNPRLSATYRFTDDISLYAAATKGFRFGGINDIPATATNNVPPVYKSDTLWNYELGLRTEWLDRTLRADLTLFNIDYKDPILAQRTQGVLGLPYTSNVSAAVSRGIEASLVWITPLEGLSTSLRGSLTDAHITEPFESSSGKTIEPGTELPGAARYQYSGGFQYARPVGRVMAGFNTSYTYVSSGFTDIEHTAPINDYGTLNAGLTFASAGIPLNPLLAINVSNITNVTAPNAAAHISSLTQVPLVINTLNPPRTITVRLGLEF